MQLFISIWNVIVVLVKQMQFCWSKLVVLFVSALNTMHDCVLQGEYFCNIPPGILP